MAQIAMRRNSKRDAARWQKMIQAKINRANIVPFTPQKTIKRAGFGITYNPRKRSFRMYNSIFFFVVLICVWLYIGQ